MPHLLQIWPALSQQERLHKAAECRCFADVNLRHRLSALLRYKSENLKNVNGVDGIKFLDHHFKINYCIMMIIYDCVMEFDNLFVIETVKTLYFDVSVCVDILDNTTYILHLGFNSPLPLGVVLTCQF